MPPPPLNQNPLVASWLSATQCKGWWESYELSACSVAARSTQEALAAEPCLFRRLLLLDSQVSGMRLALAPRKLLQELAAAGISLRCEWPRAWRSSIDEWLGRRFYLSMTTHFATNQRYLSLISSQIGRHGRKLPIWPSLVDAALQDSHRSSERPLILDGTSLSEATQQFADRAGLRSLKIHLEGHKSPADWLSDLIEELVQCFNQRSLLDIAAQLSSGLRLSPHIVPPAALEIAQRPLQDRAAIAFADRVLALHVRDHGTIASLLELRLSDQRFPTASVFVAATLGQQSRPPSNLESWLERGAVGWLIPEPVPRPDRALARCHQRERVPHTQSICFPLPQRWAQEPSAVCEWPYLAHCTRGNAGPLPDESADHFFDRAWGTGFIPDSHAISTLQKILSDQRILGNARLTRSPRRCVSFSEVPLPELLSRRQFRSHLGRWDWEPFGILVRREALELLGARRVLYGNEADYKQLADSEKPYFQPRGMKQAHTNQDWSAEREWRWIGDLDLRDLPHDSVSIFVATRSQAHQVARRCRWPVWWLAESV